MKQEIGTFKPIHGQMETTFNSADLYQEMTHDWRQKVQALHAGRWSKILAQ